ncbi:MAG: MBL fold metallo-hydrolase [Spirochaetota bacterium]
MLKPYTVGPVQTCCYLYSDDSRHLFIIDPGDEADMLIQEIDACGLAPEAILLTHTHFDHIIAVRQLMERYPSLKLYVHIDEADNLGSAGYQKRKGFISIVPALSAYLEENLKEVPQATHTLHENENIPNSHLTVLHVPGHSPGSAAFYSQEDRVLFSGDALFRESIGRTDLPGGNHKELLQSISSKLFLLPEETQVYPGHGNSTDIKHEKFYNPFFRDKSW